jgi:hypothetical protein
MSATQEYDSEKLRVFRCPNCKEYINNRMTECSFCHITIDLVVARKAVDSEDRENKIFRRQHYKRHMKIGTLVFLAGAIPTAVMLYGAYASTGELYLVFYGAIGGGLTDFLYGLDGWLGELREK